MGSSCQDSPHKLETRGRLKEGGGVKPRRCSPPALGPPPAPEALHRARGQCSGSFDSLFRITEILLRFPTSFQPYRIILVSCWASQHLEHAAVIPSHVPGKINMPVSSSLSARR